jgi:phosphate:Na+ symporter
MGVELTAFGIVVSILAGLGQFFIGMKLLSAALKEVASDRVRHVAGHVARRPVLTALLGLVAGAATQSTNAVTAAATGLATVQIITLRQAFPLIACANIGTSVLVFLAAADLHDAILIATALCGAFYFLNYDQSKKYRALLGAFLALILIIAGLELVTAAARSMRNVPEIRDVVVALAGSLLGAFVIGALLTPVVQTAKTVAAIVASLAGAGLIEPADAMMAVIGANLTSAVNVAFMTARISPTGRALAIYQALLKGVGSLVTLPLVLLVVAFAPDLLHSENANHAAMMVAITYLVAQVSAYLGILPFEAKIEEKLLQVVRRAEPDDLARPRFIGPEALRDPATAAILAFREHLGALAFLPGHLDSVREGGESDGKQARETARRSNTLLRATDDFLRQLGSQIHDDVLRMRVDSLQRLNSLAVSLQEQAAELAAIAEGGGARDPEIALRQASIVESAHLLLETFVDFVQEPDGPGRDMLNALTGDRADVMEGVRRAVMSGGGARAGQRELFDACLGFERIIWLMRRYILICDEPGSPFLIAKGLEAAAD